MTFCNRCGVHYPSNYAHGCPAPMPLASVRIFRSWDFNARRAGAAAVRKHGEALRRLADD